MTRPLIIVGASARAAAQSAIRAGYDPWCIDLFADRDLRAIAPVMRCPAENYPAGMFAMLDTEAPKDAPILFTGRMEAYPWFVEQAEFRRPLLGSPRTAVREVKDPWSDLWSGFDTGAAPVVRMPPILPQRGGGMPALHLAPLIRPGRWLIKPTGNRGPVGTFRFWTPWRIVEPFEYVQRYIGGESIGVIYRQRDGHTSVLGVTEQLVGQRWLGAQPFRYSGSIGPLHLDARQDQALAALGQALVERFGLRGLFGVDATIDARGVIWPVEVNPRYTASVEVVERATGIAALSPASDPRDSQSGSADRPAGVFAKALVFAKKPCHAPDLYAFFSEDEIADVPDPGERFVKGQPICTLFADADNRDACLARLRDMADRLYTRLL